MASGNPTLDAAQQDTGIAPLNSAPKEPQPPQHGPVVSDPTIDTIPPALQSLPPPFESIILGLDASHSRTKNKQSVSPSTYPSDSEFEDLVKAGLRPEGPVRTEVVEPQDVNWPSGYREVVKQLEDVGEGNHTKVYKVIRGKSKADLFVVSLDLDNDRLIGVKFPEQ